MLYPFNSFAIAIDITKTISFADKIDIIGCNNTFHGNIDMDPLNTLAISIDTPMQIITLIYPIDINIRISFHYLIELVSFTTL